ncbi:MAG: energy-coupling factor ABC transporter ATP-binding protein [Clostridia bacterium]
MKQYILETEDLEFDYPDGTKALRGVNIKIEQGKKVAVLGSNGAGKSTLFLHFNGIYEPSKGKIKYKGKDIGYRRADLMALRKDIGIVFQDPDSQLFSASVFQEVSFGPMNLKLNKEEVERRVNKVMEETGISLLRDKPTHFLSHGQKKRVCIADILAMEPEVIIFDEPTDSLDPMHTDDMMKLFDRLNEQGKTIIFSTHDINRVYSWADYIFILKDGKVFSEGTSQQIFTDDILLQDAGLTKPWVLEVYERLEKKGVIPKNLKAPKNKEELFNMI